MKTRFLIPSTIFLMCVMLLAGLAMVAIASGDPLPDPKDELLTYFPLVGSEYLSGGQVKVSFDRYPDGVPITVDTVLDGDEFIDSGILLAGIPPGSYCADATATAVQIPPHSAGGIDFTFLSSSRPETPLGCNAVPVEITFLEAVSEVTIVFGGARVEYVLTAYDSNDNILGTAKQAAEPEAGTIDVKFSSDTANIKRVTFGYTLAVTAITEVIYRH